MPPQVVALDHKKTKEMKKQKITCILLLLFMGAVIAVGQNRDQRIRQNSSNVDSRERTIINNGLDQTYENEDSIAVHRAELDALDPSTISGDLTVSGGITYAGPLNFRFTDPITLTNASAWSGGSKNILLAPYSGAGGSVFIKNTDTIELAYTNKLFHYDYHRVNFSTSTFIAGQTSTFNRESYLYDYISTKTTRHVVNTLGMYPRAGDTIQIPEVRVNSNMLSCYAPNTASKIELGEVTVLYTYASIDEKSSIDSLNYLSFVGADGGIHPDSIGKVFVIKNSATGAFYGKDATYFLYSEYGDNYLNGDLEVTGGITQTQLTGALTDGAPTDAQIDTATGSTPAGVGAGWAATIKDSDGSGLLYRIESDGTVWQYSVMTIAL